MNALRKLLADLRLREAVRKADKAHAASGGRYYVVPMVGTGRLVVMDRFNFRKLKQKRYMSPATWIAHLEKSCYYHTPYADGSKGMNEEEKLLGRIRYLAWVESL